MAEPKAWTEFEDRMRDWIGVRKARSIVSWDQQVMMPRGGAGARGAVASVLAGIEHERLTSKELVDLVTELRQTELAPEREAMVRRLGREQDRARRLPASLAAELARARSDGQTTWEEARRRDDWAMFQPVLERLLALKADEAEAIGYETEPYEAHLDSYEEGISVSEVESTFARIAEALAPMIAAVGERPDGRGLPAGPHDVDAQLDYCRDLAVRLGLGEHESRLDLSAHPFTTYFAGSDVRITTRLSADDPLPSILATMHETGHALYGTGLPKEWEGTAIASSPSSGANESQSRLWENHVGRSLPFWEGEVERLAAAVPSLRGVSAEQVFLAANVAGASLIRVDADELTYPLHIILRLELELAITRGEVKAADLPAAWNEAMRRHLGIVPGSDALGVMQDVHWSTGLLGYFPTYLLGSMWAASIFDTAVEALGGAGVMDDRLRAGAFVPLLSWLTDQMYSKGGLLLGRELVAQITGASDDIEPYVAHLTARRESVAELS